MLGVLAYMKNKQLIALLVMVVLCIVGLLGYLTFANRDVGMGVPLNPAVRNLANNVPDEQSPHQTNQVPDQIQKKEKLTIWLGTNCAPLSKEEEEAWLLAEGRTVSALLAVAISNINERRNDLLKEVLKKDLGNLTALLYGSFDPSFTINSEELIANAKQFHPANAYVNLVEIKGLIKNGNFQEALAKAVSTQNLPIWETNFSQIKSKIRDMYVDSGRVEAAAEIRNFLELDDQILMNSIINATHLVNMADFSSATTRDKATLLAVFEKIMDNSKDSVSAYMLSLNTQKAIIQSGAQDGDSFDKYLDRSGIEFTKSIQSDIDAAGQLMSLTVEPTEAIEGLTVDQRLEFARKLRNIGAVDAAMSLNRR